MLQRARELTVQAANGTLTTQDRASIQMEIDEIKGGIDSIANETQFNTIELLRPPKVTKPPSPGGLGNQPVDIVFFIDDSGTMQEEIDEVVEGISNFVNGLSQYGDVKVSTVSTVHSGRTLPLTSDIAMIQQHLRENHRAESGTNYAYQKMTSYAPSGLQAGEIDYRNDSKKIFVLLTDTYDEGSVQTEPEVKQTLEDNNIYSYVFGIDISSVSPTNVFSYSGSYDDFANEIFIPASSDEIVSNISPGLVDKIVEDTGLGSEQELVYEPLILQVGPNSGDQFTMHLFDARTPNLGIDNIKVDPWEEAQIAINKIDNAIEKMSSERSKFGAYQNALEYIHTNVTNAGENATASESRISDADMALEMTEFTKRNILIQSGQAMLAQSNQLPQGILQLLK